MTNPSFKLGDLTFEVAPFVFRELPKAIPMVMKTGTLMASGSLTEEGLANLNELVFYAANRANPDYSREQFDSNTGGINELRDAIPAIAQAAGMKKAEPGEA